MSVKVLYAVIVLAVIAISTLTVSSSSSTTGGVGYQADFPHARVLVLDVLEDLTLRVTPPVRVQGVYRDLIKLADISPRPGSREKLVNLITAAAGIVYLDLDPQAVESGRAVATAYARINTTHILNLNKWLVENGYADIADALNVFDPTKWVLHFVYPVESEKLPPVARIVLCENCPISNATTWGVNVKTTPNRAYLAVTYTLNETPQLLRIVVLDRDGKLVRHEVVNDTNVALGYVDVASNGTGFFVTWRDLTIGPNRARCAFIPLDPTLPVNVSDRVFGGGGSWHSSPIAAWNPFNESWVVIYVHQTIAWRPRYFINFVNRAGLPAGGTGAIWLSPPGGTNRTGIDIQGRLIYDPVSRNFAFVSRNETAPGEFNIEVIIFPADKPAPLSEVVDVFRVYIDERPGPQGPEPAMFNASFAYFNLYPSIHSTLLGSGRYLLVVYNDTSRSLAYSVVDLLERAVLTRDTLVSLEADTTFYPWISGGSVWVVVWSAGEVVNASIAQPSAPYIVDTFTISGTRSRSPRATYDPASKLHAIAYTVELPGAGTGLYMVFVRDKTPLLEPWILPVIANATDIVPLYVVALETGGTAGNLGVVALEGGSLVLYVVNSTYPSMLEPAKNAMPVETPTPTPTPPPTTPVETVTVTVTRTVTTTLTTVTTTTTTMVTTQVLEKTVEKTLTIVEEIEETVTETVTTTITMRYTVTTREAITEVRAETTTITYEKTLIPPEAEYANVVLAIGVIALVGSAALLFLTRRRS